MYSYLSRHKVDLESSTDYETGCGKLMYDAWGGEPALEWSKRIIERYEEMDINVSNLPEYVNYPTGDTKNDMLIEDVGFIEKIPYERKEDYISRCIAYHIDKGYEASQASAICYQQAEEDFADEMENPCWEGYEPYGTKIVDGREVPNCVPVKQGAHFGIMGYLGDIPVFATPEDAIEYGNAYYNCDGYHEHELENGEVVYMSCSSHDDMINAEYGEDDLENLEALYALSSYSTEFDVILNDYVLGYDRNQVIGMNHKNPTIYFRYDRVANSKSNDHRDFCMENEGRYFRRMQIDLMKNSNLQFGHNQEPYSKWLFKGGPNCIHGWRKFIVQEGNFADLGIVPGLPGTAPKEMKNNGYYSEETKRRSEIAYIITQKQREGFSRTSRKAIIVDIDGTLVDGISPKQSVIDYINEKWSNNRIIVISGRRSSDLLSTKRELMRIGLKYDEIYLNDGNLSSNNFKYEKADKLMNKGIEIIEAIDDNVAARTQYGRLGIKVSSPSNFSSIMKKSVSFKADDEKRMIYSPLMVPGILIPRIDETTNERFFVRFSEDAIERIQNKFMIEMRLRETNYEHSEQKFNDIAMVESWLVKGENDKAFELGYNRSEIPNGTWMVGYKILDTPEGDNIWNNYIKTGKVRGLSSEGNFLMNFSQQKNGEYLLEQIINILESIN